MSAGQTGTWPLASRERESSWSWLGGLTRRGRPPRGTTVRTRRLLLLIFVGYALMLAGLLRLLLTP